MGKVFNPLKASARDILAAEYGRSSRNFMTPEVLHTGKAGPSRAWELSKGEGFRRPGQSKGKTIYGVSVVDVDLDTGETTRRRDISKCCHSQHEADKLIANLKEIE